MSTAVVWFRADLRLGDNPAWAAATSSHDTVVPLFVLDPVPLAGAGPLRRDLLLAHLGALDRDLESRGGRLMVHRGDPTSRVVEVVATTGASVVHVNHEVGRYASRRDRAVARAAPTAVHHGRTVHPVGTVVTGGGRPYRVFTPFHRAWEAHPWEPWPEAQAARITSDAGDGLPRPATVTMPAGERGATARLEEFLDRVDRYDRERDRPDLDSTSRLSADLHFGTIAARTVATAVGDASAGARGLLRQLAWREFYAQLLAAYPAMPTQALRPEYSAVRWRDDPAGLEAWQQGRTGYPLVDAGMRQLLAEGWMHNRVRMVTASFLVKDLLIDWRLGERWFRRHLIDADLAQNAGNWQWVAGTGSDAAPYFRILNPVAQSRRFDPEGDYIRRWIPELRGLDNAAIHAPWDFSPDVGYPAPIVDHAAARDRALAAYRRL